MKTMLFNPYTGKPRDPRDIASDPSGTLMLDPDEPLLAAKTAVAQPVADERDAYDKWCVSKGYNTNKWITDFGPVYIDNYTLNGWEAWQARAALGWKS